MVPALGNKVEWHFRHKHDDIGHCSEETYLHRLAKRLFVNAYRKALKDGTAYYLRQKNSEQCSIWKNIFGFICEQSPSLQKFDLTSSFDRIQEEVAADGFIADVLLYSSNTDSKLLIEMKVSHGCTPEKLASGLRIIEIEINSEASMDAFGSGLDTSDNRLSTYNFKPLLPEELPCRFDCGRKLRAFHVFRNGEVYPQFAHPSDVARTKELTDTVYTQLVHHGSQGILPNEGHGIDIYEESIKAFLLGLNVRNCTICNHSALFINDTDEAFCKKRKTRVPNNEAISCEIFQPGEK